ncbi:hypothetical protein LSCM1_05697 [Leishmania martiniquensis]|uniref:DNA topoisomerase (ATP-hydrolyzing) n=1 Tax=Leishmania martiniquensis TaxID=1580590 RepID=A0A836KNK3_9TRYP|nr:hypothetical protein LSCM1_05697 [Leishmania martiniquensis]
MTDSFAEVSPAVVAATRADELRDEALRRMEVYVLELLHALLSTPAKQVPSRGHRVMSVEGGASGSCPRRAQPVMPRKLQTWTNAAGDATSATLVSVIREEWGHAASAPGYEGAEARSGNDQHTRNMHTLQTARHHLAVLAVLFFNVVRGDVATQRDVYYHLVREISAQVVVNRTVQQISRVLRLPREMMGVTAGGRGYIAGWLWYRGVSLQSGWTGVTAEEGMPLPLLAADLIVSVRAIAECAAAEDDDDRGISGSAPLPNGANTRPPQLSESSRSAYTRDPSLNSRSSIAAADGFQVSPKVCAILVVEKHAVFVQLLREGLPRRLPCVLLTAQGFPTHAARRLLAHLHAALPRAAVVGLVDYNPYGLAILAAYRWAATFDALPAGSAPMESRYYAVPALRWLGMRTAHVTRVIEKRDSDTASTGDSSISQNRYLHDSTPPPLRARGEPWGGTHNGSRASGKEVAASCAPKFVSSTLHAEKNAAVASSRMSIAPFQQLTHRDTVVMGHQIKRLEYILHHAATPSAASEALRTKAAADVGDRELVEQHHVKWADRTSVNFDAAHESHCMLWEADPKQQANRASAAAWLDEARKMQRLSVKCEMEALYTVPYASLFLGAASAMRARRPGAPPPPSQFAEWVCQQVLRRQYT